MWLYLGYLLLQQATTIDLPEPLNLHVNIELFGMVYQLSRLTISYVLLLTYTLAISNTLRGKLVHPVTAHACDTDER